MCSLLHTIPCFLAKTIHFLSLRWKRRGDNHARKQKEEGTEKKKGVVADSEKRKVVLLVVLGSIMADGTVTITSTD